MITLYHVEILHDRSADMEVLRMSTSNIVQLPAWRMGFYDIEALALWVQGARPGDQATYFLGSLAEARDWEHSAIPHHDLRRINEIADAAREFERRGLVALVQERAGEDAFRYIIIRNGRAAPVRRHPAMA
jgi:hypothetical protein